MHGSCMDVRPMHTKPSDPINSGHYVRPANHHLRIESPPRSKPGRENERNNCRLKKYQPVTYASLYIYSEPYLYPAISVQPAHINQINHSAKPTNECAQAHTVKINSGHQNLPDENSKVLNFASVNQKHQPPVVRPIPTGCPNPANPATSLPMTRGSYKSVTPMLGSPDM